MTEVKVIKDSTHGITGIQYFDFSMPVGGGNYKTVFTPAYNVTKRKNFIRNFSIYNSQNRGK